MLTQNLTTHLISEGDIFTVYFLSQGQQINLE